MHKDINYKRLKYVRYADAFLIGIIGSKQDCINIRAQIKTFLDQILKVNIDLDKTKITNAKDSIVEFLGTDIRLTPLSKRPPKKIIRGNSVYFSRVNTRPQLLAPIAKLVSKLVIKGIAKPGGRPTR